MKTTRCYDYVDMATVINKNTISLNSKIHRLEGKSNAMAFLGLGFMIAIIFNDRDIKARMYKLEKRVKELEEDTFLS